MKQWDYVLSGAASATLVALRGEATSYVVGPSPTSIASSCSHSVSKTQIPQFVHYSQVMNEQVVFRKQIVSAACPLLSSSIHFVLVDH